VTIKYSDFLTKLDRTQEYDKYVSGMCPFEAHSSPALLVFKDGWFRCLSCGRSGSWQQLWNKLQGQHIIIRPEGKTSWKGPSIHEDLESICYQSHLDLVQFSSYQWYLQERGLEGRIEVNEIGYYEGWYSIPIRSEDGNFITAVFRSSPHVQQTTGMRYYCRHVPVPFFPDYNVVKENEYLLVVYGIFDALTLADLRFPVVTSSAGKDTFNPEWLDKHRKKIYIIPDKGEEDTAYGLASQLDFRGKVINLDYPEHVKDCNGFYEQKKGELLRRQIMNVITAKSI
jgi:hypothetical protein